MASRPGRKLEQNWSTPFGSGPDRHRPEAEQAGEVYSGQSSGSDRCSNRARNSQPHWVAVSMCREKIIEPYSSFVLCPRSLAERSDRLRSLYISSPGERGNRPECETPRASAILSAGHRWARKAKATRIRSRCWSSRRGCAPNRSRIGGDGFLTAA